MKSKPSSKVSRRKALQAGAGLALAGSLPANAAPASKPANVYEALGLRTFINAAGTITTMGGSVMPAEVVAAWVDASKHFVDLLQLHDKVGERIAKLIGVPAALVTTGAAGAILLGTAAAVTGGDREAIGRLPDTTGLKNEVILQKRHHSGYDNQMQDVGVKFIDVETPADVAKAVNERTALMFFMNINDGDGRINREAWLALARKYKVPTLLDAAADAPPVERLSAYNRMGFDLVAFSGGKAIRGPNDTGLLLGRKDLIEAGKLCTNPYGRTIGRMMKVGKEDMIALLHAVERFVRLDRAAEDREWDNRLTTIERMVKELPSVTCRRIIPPIANHVPHLIVAWNEKKLKISRDGVTRALAEGEPSIRIGRVGGTGDEGLLFSVLTLQDGEAEIIGNRLREILQKAGS